MKSERPEAWMQLPTSRIRPLNRFTCPGCIVEKPHYALRRRLWGLHSSSSHFPPLQVNSVLTNVHCSSVPSSLHCRWAYHTVHMTDNHDLWWYRCCVCTQLWVWTRQNSSGAETDRSPLDFSEDERELVPGFNFEYDLEVLLCCFFLNTLSYFRFLIVDTISLKQQECTLSIFKIICSRRLPKNA